MVTRVKIAEFGIIQKQLAHAVVTFYVADENGRNTGVKAILYRNDTGPARQENPQTLDENGQLASDCYVESGVMATISGINPLLARTIKKIRQNPDEFQLFVTSASYAALVATTFINETLNDPGFIAVSEDLLGPNNIGAVASSIGNVDIVAGDIANINIVATNISDVIIAANNISDIGTVATNIADVNTLAANIADVNTAATNITAIIAAPQAAQDAEDARDLAQNYAAALTGTSTTSLTIGTGSTVFTTQAGKQWALGQRLRAASDDGTKIMEGEVTAYTGTSLTINVDYIESSGTHADWNIGITGTRGVDGAPIDFTTMATDTPVAADYIVFGDTSASDAPKKNTITVLSNLILMGSAGASATQGDSIIRGASNWARIPMFQVSALGNITTTATCNLSNARAFTATVTGSVTFSFSNSLASGYEDIFTLRLTNGGAFLTTWPASVDWARGVPPVLTTSGVDELVFKTTDGGTTWIGSALLDVK